MRNLLALLLLAPCALLAQVPDYVPTDGLVAWYPLDGEVTNVLDPTEAGSIESATNGTGYDGTAGGCLGFVANEWAYIQPSIGITEELTVSLWVNEGTNPPNSYQTPIYLGQEGFSADTTFSLDISRDRQNYPSPGLFRANLNYNFGYAGYTELDGGWVHVTSVFDHGQLSIYRNGILMESVSASVDAISIDGPSVIGAGHSTGEDTPFNFCHCALDEIGIWTRALSGTEIAGIHSEQPIPQIPDYVPSDGLVAWYPLDSTALDESGHGHHLTLDGPTWSAGTDNAGDQSLLFDGQDDVALIPHHPDFNSPEMSLSFWVNVHTDQLLDSPGLSDFMGVINKTDLDAPVLDRRQFDVQLYAESAGTSPFNLGWLASTGHSVNELDVELVTAPANLPAFEWNHIVVTASDSTLSIHINGEHIATNALLHPRVLNTADVQIGRDYLGLAQRHFNGRMDDIAFYNRVLTADEVTDLYQSSSSEEPCFDFSEVPGEIHLDNGPVTLQLGPGESSPQAGSNGAVTISEPGLFVLERSVGDAHLSLVQDSSWVDFGDILNDLTPPVSFSFDVRLTGNGGPILATDNGNPSYYNGYWMSLNNSELACAFGDGGWHGGGERRTGRLYSDFAQNEWYHITCVVNGANDFAFYLDGVEQTTSYNDAGSGGPVNFTSDPMKLGHHNAASPGTGAHYDQCFTGDLNNVTVWHRALNGAEASALQEGGLPEDLTALVAHWDFNDATSGVVPDASGLGHDGQLMGNATISTTPQCTTTDTIVVHGPMAPDDRIGGALEMDGVDDYASFTLPAGWGESSFSVSFSCTLEDFGSTDIDGYHYLFGHALTNQNGDIGFKAQTVPDAQQVIWAFSDDDGDGALSLLSDQVLEPDTWHVFTLVFDRDSALATVFVDGVPTGAATIPSTMGNLESGLPVGLGAFVYPPGGNLQHFHQGAFADVHFFPAALTEAEIHSLLLECTPPDIPGAAHWGVNGDQYVNLTTQEPATVVGGTIVNDTLPCPTPGTTDLEEEENQALDFPGIDVPYSESGVMEVPYDAALDRTGADPFTIAADVLLEDDDWFNLFHTGQDGDPENNITFRLSPSEINLFWENTGVNYELNGALASQQLGPLATGQWHHIAASWDGSTLALFVNGLEIATDSPSNGGPGETADRSFYWGSKHGENSLHGQLDNAQFWTVGLSQSDIIGYMECPPVGNEPGLEGYWTFDGPDADIALDITGNGHDGSTLGLSRVTSTRPACSSGTADLFGCTDSTACNYDPTATQDDDSCLDTVSLELGPDILTCDDAVTLDASGTFNHYNWSNGGEEASTTVYSTGTYIVTAGFGTTNGTALDFSDELETAFISGTNNNCVQDYLSGSMDLGVAQNAISAVTVEFETSSGSICGGSCASWGIKLELRNDAGQTVDSLVVGEVFGASCIQTGTTGTFTFTPDFTSDQTDAPVLFLQSVDFASASARITHIEFGNPTCTVTDSIQVLMTDCAALDALCGEGSIWDNEAQQCTDTLNDGSFPCGTGTVWDPVAQECIVAIPTDTDFDGCVAAGDLLNLLGTFGSCPPIPEWPDTPSDTTSTSWMCGDPLPYQGYDYATVQIGDQCWFAENLRNTAYSTGEPIETVANIEDWVASTEGLVATYGTNVWGCQNLEFAPFDVCNPDSSLQYFGRHYNWYAVNDTRGLCPSGWHVPSDSNFATMEAFLGLPADELFVLGERGENQGSLVKSSPTDDYPWNGNNTTGFSAVPGGSIHNGLFTPTPSGGAGLSGSIWTSSGFLSGPPYAWFRGFRSNHDQITRDAFYRYMGRSVRCLKD